MPGKVILVIFLAMLLFTEHSMANDNINQMDSCVAVCARFCGDVECFATCMDDCGSSDKDESALRVCNVRCSLGHCSKFLFQYDEKMFGTCMTSCRKNRCVGMIKMEA